MYSTDKCHFCHGDFKLYTAFKVCNNCKYEYRVWDDNIVTFFIEGMQFTCDNKEESISVFDEQDVYNFGWIEINKSNVDQVIVRFKNLKLFS